MTGARKVRFIEPAGRPGRPFNVWLAQWPLLGPITLATILRRRGYDAAVYNENVSGSLLENEAAYADVCSADVAGISIMTPTAARGYALADRIRREAPATTVVIGGTHATFLPGEALQHGDIVVRGEGESVIERIAAGGIQPGVIEAPPVEDLDSLPAPDFSLMQDFDRVLARFRRRDLYELPVMTSRGCPYNCTYCSVSRMFGQRVRRQSVEKVYADLCSYAEQGFRQFFFYDDNFTSDRRWTRQLMGRMRGSGFGFRAQARVDFPWLDGRRKLLDKPLLEALQEAGGHMLYVGYETLEEATASEWKKGYRGQGALEGRLLADTRILHDYGFWIHGMFMAGPEHGQESIDRIVAFARRGKLETMHLSILTPLPGTPLFDQMRPHLIFTDFPGDWNFYDGAHCVYDHGRLGIRQLQEAVLRAHQRFYRGYSWSVRRIRDALRPRAPLMDKLALMVSTARSAQRALRQWQEDVNTFVELARRRQSSREQHA